MEAPDVFSVESFEVPTPTVEVVPTPVDADPRETEEEQSRFAKQMLEAADELAPEEEVTEEQRAQSIVSFNAVVHRSLYNPLHRGPLTVSLEEEPSLYDRLIREAVEADAKKEAEGNKSPEVRPLREDPKVTKQLCDEQLKKISATVLEAYSSTGPVSTRVNLLGYAASLTVELGTNLRVLRRVIKEEARLKKAGHKG